MSLKFGTSNRGRPTLIFEGYEYVKKQETNTTTHWICRNYRTIKCSTIVITSGDAVINIPKDHLCNFKPGATEARELKNVMKEKALSMTNYNAISSSLQSVHDNVATQLNLPKQETLVKTLNRYKRKFEGALPSIPHTTDFQIPDEFLDFVAYDKGINDPDRFLIFALPEMLSLMESQTSIWLVDGTFKQCPQMFYQLYTIHIAIGGYHPPCLYALLPNKTEKTYRSFCQALSEIVPNGKPQRIMMDFEKAAMNAFRDFYPTTQISGCYFHLRQSAMRKINEFGLKKEYETIPELALTLKMVSAVVFLPINQVEEGFFAVMEEIGEVLKMQATDDISDKVELFVCYFEKNLHSRYNKIALVRSFNLESKPSRR